MMTLDDEKRDLWSDRKDNAKITRKEIRRIAKASESGLEGEQAKHIALLQKAERDLLLVSSFFGLIFSLAVSDGPSF